MKKFKLYIRGIVYEFLNEYYSNADNNEVLQMKDRLDKVEYSLETHLHSATEANKINTLAEMILNHQHKKEVVS